MRFYDLDGIEIEIADISFYLDKNNLLELQEVVTEILDSYA